MDDIVLKLGRPAALAQDIVEEFNLNYNDKTVKETTLPKWAKIILICSGLLVGFPLIIAVFSTLIGLIFGIGGAMVGISFALLAIPFYIWSATDLTFMAQVLGSLSSILLLISLIIIFYFIVYGLVRIIKSIFYWIKKSLQGRSKDVH